MAVLMPMVEVKFLAKWQGPLEMVEKMSHVNYEVHQPGKRKLYQIYHVNLLKPLRDREPVSAVVGVNSGYSAGVDLVQVAATLSKLLTQQAKDFLQRNRKMFLGLPCLTNVIEHDIVTEPNGKISSKPYHIPEADNKSVFEEVKILLELVVLLKKSHRVSGPNMLE